MASLFSAILPDHLKEKLGMRTSKERDKSGMFLLKLPIYTGIKIMGYGKLPLAETADKLMNVHPKLI